MFIKSLEIKNDKFFVDTKLEFDPKLNVIVGINESDNLDFMDLIYKNLQFVDEYVIQQIDQTSYLQSNLFSVRFNSTEKFILTLIDNGKEYKCYINKKSVRIKPRMNKGIVPLWIITLWNAPFNKLTANNKNHWNIGFFLHPEFQIEYIHPYYHPNIIKSVKNLKNKQVFILTSSPVIVDCVEPNNIFVVYRKKNRGYIKKITELDIIKEYIKNEKDFITKISDYFINNFYLDCDEVV